MMIDAATLIEMLDRNFGVIQAQVAGVTHEESLIQPPFNANCLNWVMGHIVQNRNKMLHLISQPTVWSHEQTARYEMGSAPVKDGHDALPFERMVADLSVCHQRLIPALERLSLADLDAVGNVVIAELSHASIGWMMNYLIWHETYHVGQTDILRQAAGKNDKII